MNIQELYTKISLLKFRSIYERAVKTYALEMLNKCIKGEHDNVTAETDVKNLNVGILVSNVHGERFKLVELWGDHERALARSVVCDACFGAVFLVSNVDIANRLYPKAQRTKRLIESDKPMTDQSEAVWEAISLIRNTILKTI